jgi:small subunit ribosomal protein S13
MAEKAAPAKEHKILRISETDLDGSKPVAVAIRKVKGVSFMFSNAVSKTCGFGNKKMEELSDQEIEKLKDVMKNPEKYNIPHWLYNRRKDPASGNYTHITSSALDMTKKGDIDRMKKIRCYKGVRHMLGLPVRGQRTKSSFRTGGIVGVKRKKEIKPGAAAAGDNK